MLTIDTGNVMDLILVEQLGISLGLGLIVGFQREWGSSHVAGIRSFALITLLGTICAKLGALQGGWVLPFGLIAVTALVISGSFVKFSSGEIGPAGASRSKPIGAFFKKFGYSFPGSS